MQKYSRGYHYFLYDERQDFLDNSPKFFEKLHQARSTYLVDTRTNGNDDSATCEHPYDVDKCEESPNLLHDAFLIDISFDLFPDHLGIRESHFIPPGQLLQLGEGVCDDGLIS
jgi:hypothetical protein